MATARLKSLTEQSNFYRDYYQTLIIVLIVAIFLMLGMVGVVLYQIFHRPLPQFIAIAQDGKKLELTSFNEPNLLPSTLLKWASKAAVASYTFDFVNYAAQVLNARPYYTLAGWGEYRGSVIGLLNDIASKQLFVNGVVAGPPIISNQGELPGRGYAWRIQLPFLVTYQSSENTSKKNYLVVETIVKVPTNIDPTGIGIDQFVMREQ